jgi:hypothetical protein
MHLIILAVGEATGRGDERDIFSQREEESLMRRLQRKGK